MKKQLLHITLILIINAPSFATHTIYKTWIGENLEYLELTKRKANFDYGHNIDDYGVNYKDSILTLIDYFWLSGKIGRQHKDYKFKVLRLTSDSLIVSPINDRACHLIKNKEVFVFVDKTKLYNADLKFQKLFFSNSSAKLEIDSTGLIYFFAEYKIENYKGLYKGQLNQIQFDELIELLKKSELDKFPIGLHEGFDSPKYRFKFYYNDKQRSSEGGMIPYFSRPLLNYLNGIFEVLNLEKTEETFVFE